MRRHRVSTWMLQLEWRWRCALHGRAQQRSRATAGATLDPRRILKFSLAHFPIVEYGGVEPTE